MSGKAAIYIRVSSEAQAVDKSGDDNGEVKAKGSPEEQEADCLQLAQDKGLEVVGVYKDITRYRVKDKWVEPSATRDTRPGLIQMLADGESGKFDTLIAWREDRLYRTICKAFLNVHNFIKDNKITVYLVKENYDPLMAELKASIAGIELQGIKDRMAMGAQYRLKSGAPMGGQDLYGYHREGKDTRVVVEEAETIHLIYDLYIRGVNLLDIRQKLIEINAPQKGGSRLAEIPWSKQVIQNVLDRKAAATYATGIRYMKRGGKTFEIKVPQILDDATFRAYSALRDKHGQERCRNSVKYDYLMGGKLFCACSRSWQTATARRKRVDGSYYYHGTYRCTEDHQDKISPDCPRFAYRDKIEGQLWEKVKGLLLNPDLLMLQAVSYFEMLKEQSEQAQGDIDRLQGELDAVDLQRQRVVNLAGRGLINDEDLTTSLAGLTLQQNAFRAELDKVEAVSHLTTFDDWKSGAMAILDDSLKLLDEIERCEINIKRSKKLLREFDRIGIAKPEFAQNTIEAEKEIFKIKKSVCDSMIDRVTIDRDRNLKIRFKFIIPENEIPPEELKRLQEARAGQNETPDSHCGRPDH